MALLAACLCFTALAYGLNVTAAVNPPSLLGPDKVEITLTMQNTSDSWVEDVRLDANTGRIYKFGDIDPKSKKSYKLSNFQIDEYQLGVPMDFQFSYMQDGQQQQTGIQVLVEQRTARPDISASRTANVTSGAKGDQVTLTYTLENIGDIDLENVSVTDPVSDKPIASGLFLPAGGKPEKIEYTFSLEKTVTSNPTVKAESDGGDINTTIEPLTVHLSEPFLDVIVNAKEATGEGTPLEIAVNNTGNVAINSLTLTDEKGVIIADGFSLEPGKSKSFNHTVPASPTARTFEATVKGITADGEKSVEFMSEGVHIGPIVSAEDVKVEMTVAADKTALDAPGEVNVTIQLNNASPVDLSNVVIEEKTAGAIRRLDSLPMGIHTETVTLLINTTSPLELSVTVQDPAGGSHTFSAEPITIEVAAAQPEPTEPPEEEGSAFGISPALIWAVVIILLLLGAAVVALVVIIKREKRQKEQQEEAEALDRILVGRDSSRTGAPFSTTKTDIRPARPAGQERQLRHPGPDQRQQPPVTVRTQPPRSQYPAQDAYPEPQGYGYGERQAPPDGYEQGYGAGGSDEFSDYGPADYNSPGDQGRPTFRGVPYEQPGVNYPGYDQPAPPPYGQQPIQQPYADEPPLSPVEPDGRRQPRRKKPVLKNERAASIEPEQPRRDGYAPGAYPQDNGYPPQQGRHPRGPVNGSSGQGGQSGDDLFEKEFLDE